jgi:hypothetical protein
VTAQEPLSLKVGDRVRSGDRTGAIDLIVSGIFIIKWEGRNDCGAYTREAVEKQFTRCGPTSLLMSRPSDRGPSRL